MESSVPEYRSISWSLQMLGRWGRSIGRGPPWTPGTWVSFAEVPCLFCLPRWIRFPSILKPLGVVCYPTPTGKVCSFESQLRKIHRCFAAKRNQRKMWRNFFTELVFNLGIVVESTWWGSILRQRSNLYFSSTPLDGANMWGLTWLWSDSGT